LLNFMTLKDTYTRAHARSDSPGRWIGPSNCTSQHTTLTRDMPLRGFEATNPASDRLQPNILHGATTGMG
jgi:hypothetical protein